MGTIFLGPFEGHHAHGGLCPAAISQVVKWGAKKGQSFGRLFGGGSPCLVVLKGNHQENRHNVLWVGAVGGAYLFEW